LLELEQFFLFLLELLSRLDQFLLLQLDLLFIIVFFLLGIARHEFFLEFVDCELQVPNQVVFLDDLSEQHLCITVFH